MFRRWGDNGCPLPLSLSHWRGTFTPFSCGRRGQGDEGVTESLPSPSIPLPLERDFHPLLLWEKGAGG